MHRGCPQEPSSPKVASCRSNKPIIPIQLLPSQPQTCQMPTKETQRTERISSAGCKLYEHRTLCCGVGRGGAIAAAAANAGIRGIFFLCELFPPSYECSMGCVTALCSALPRCRAFARFPRFPRCFPRCRAFRAAFRAFGFALCSLGAFRAAALSALLSAMRPRWDARRG